MSDFHPLTVQLSLEERSTLIVEAQRRNLSPDVLALQLLKDGIAQMQILKQQTALDAIERLDKLVNRLPLVVDAVELARASREELEQRGQLSQ